MSDSSESFTDVQEPMVTEQPTQASQQQGPQSINDHLTILYQQLQELNQRSKALEHQLVEANRKAINAEHRATLAEQQAVIARENTNIRVAAPANKVKVRKPDDFDGSRARVDYFIRQLKGYLAQEPNLHVEAQLNIALGFCTGKIAGTWADRQANLIAENKEGRLLSLAEFEKKIRDTFGDPEKGSTARHQLQLLKQRGKPIEQFIIDFEMLEADAELDEVALIEQWKRAIDKHIWEKCYEALEIPKTLKEWKDRCLIYDRNFRRRAEESALRNNNFPVKRFQAYPSQNLPSRFNNPSATNTNRPWSGNNFNRPFNNFRNSNFPVPQNKPIAQPPQVSNNTHTPMEIDRTRRPQAANIQRRPLICYNCGRPGHRRFECPENHIRTVEAAEEEVEQKEVDDKGFPEADEE